MIVKELNKEIKSSEQLILALDKKITKENIKTWKLY